MIDRLFVCSAAGTNPYENLAVEETLLGRVGAGEIIFYLWQNARTVVIGKNQNPWKECRTALLAEEGGSLARRLSGGGAVFHDLGNLNFTFLVPEADYDVSRQLTVIERACKALGVPVERSGRNDLLAGGRKFSGNAFYKHEGRCYHHGTIMVDVDMDLVTRYLSPSKAKLQAKGVDSVRSRVVNLREFVPELTIEALKAALTAACSEVYGHPAEPLALIRADWEKIARLTARNRSEEWLYGRKLPFTLSVEDRFPWGGIEIRLDVNEGVIRGVQAYTDAMDDGLSQTLEACLTGASFRNDALTEAMERTALPQGQREDLLALLQSAL